MARDTRLMLWPEQKSYFPLIDAWTDTVNTSTLDFTSCHDITSCGLAATALNIHRLFTRKIQSKINKAGNHISLLENNLLIERIIENENPEIMDHCLNLGFFKCISDLLVDSENKRFNNNNKLNTNELQKLPSYLSLPVCRLYFNKKKHNQRREVAFEFASDIRSIFTDYLYKTASSKGAQVTTILYEIAKNIADHTMSDGFMGLDISQKNDFLRISILIGDSGPGVYTHLKPSYVKRNPERSKNIGFIEVWWDALQDGVSGGDIPTQQFGSGMSSIVNNCKALGIRISAFDQNRRVVLSELPNLTEKIVSYNKLGHLCYRFDGSRPFAYYLEWEVSL